MTTTIRSSTPPFSKKRSTPSDHLPAWRRVSFGFLVQQGSAAGSPDCDAAPGIARIALPDDPADDVEMTDESITGDQGLCSCCWASAFR